MSGFVDTMEQSILNLFLRTTAWTLPAALHFGLSTTTPTEAAGNLIWWAALTTPQAAGTGNDVEVAAGALDFKLGDPGDSF